MTRSIVIVIGTLDIGGTERQLRATLPTLAGQGIPVAVHTLIDVGPLGHELRRLGIEVYTPFEKYRSLRQYRLGKLLLLMASAVRLLHLMVTGRAFVVHCYLPAAYLIAGVCAATVGYRHLILSRRSLNRYQTKHGVLSRLERALHARLFVAIGNSRAIVDELEAEGIAPGKLCLIYNGVSFEREKGKVSMTRTLLGIPPDAVVVVCLANLIPYKAHEDLIDAWARLGATADRAIRLICVGCDHGHLRGLRKRCEQLGVTPSVIWAGESDRPGDYVALADIGVLVSHQEGFSNAILEYMCARLPVVATQVGGNAEQVIDGDTGYLVATTDIEAIAERLSKLIDNGELRTRMGAAGYQRVVTHFPLSHTIAQTARIYNAAWLRRLRNDALLTDHDDNRSTAGDEPTGDANEPSDLARELREIETLEQSQTPFDEPGLSSLSEDLQLPLMRVPTATHTGIPDSVAR